MKKLLFTLICIMNINMANSQIVNIPDAIFKARLVSNAAINTNGDGEIQVTEAAAYSGAMNVSTLSGAAIMDLTGIEAFTALTNLNCSMNGLSSLNVSANTALDTLDCYFNFLTSLDVSSNTALTYLRCTHNYLTSLDVSANTALTYLNCYTNQLTSLNLSANTALNVLLCNDNQIASLDVSTNTALTYLYCAGNPLVSLDVSTNPALTYLVCEYNQLTSLNVQNGNNSNFTNFDATNNPNLTCIQVDSVAYSNTNWSAGKDASASFSTNCGALSVPDIGNWATVQIVPNPATNHFTIDLPNANEKVKVTITDITGKIIYKTSSFAAQKLEVNTEDFSAGVYLVQVQSADFIATKKLVVEK